MTPEELWRQQQYWLSNPPDWLSGIALQTLRGGQNTAVYAVTGTETAAAALNPLDWEIFGISLKYWLLIGGAVLLLKK